MIKDIVNALASNVLLYNIKSKLNQDHLNLHT